MRDFINYFIKYPIAGNMLMVGLFVFGIYGMFQMKSTSFPEVPSRIINIQAVYLGASPEEVEEGIVSKIEENLKGLTGIKQITSVSKENLGVVTVELIKGQDTDVSLQEVKNAVDGISSFPASMEPPTVFKGENLGNALRFALSGNVDLKTLKFFGRQVEDDLLAMDGISKVTLSGFPEEEIEISFREQDLQNYQLSFQQATRAIQVSNLEISGGTIKGKKEELLVRAKNKKYYADELRDIVVKQSPEGGIIRLHQVADIKDKWADEPARTYLNNIPTVIVTVQNTLQEDMISIANMTKEYVQEFNQENEVIKAEVISDFSLYLNQRIGTLTKNGISGFIIVLILLALFLNWRLAFWVAIAIPISFAGMFLVTTLIGVTINVISLFGMILVIGILVDDGIVIAENIYQKYESGMPRMEAAIEGTMQVLPAVFSAILTTVIVFSSFYLIEGRIGDFFSEMATVVIFSLIFSLVEGVLILPAHIAHSKALSPNRKRNPVSEALDGFMFWMRDKLYGPVLKFSMYNKFLTIAVVVGMFLVTMGAIFGGIIKGTFFPNIDRDSVVINLKMPAGTQEDITQKWLNHIETKALIASDELSEEYFGGQKQAILKIEKALGPSTYEGKITLTLLDSESRDGLGNQEIITRVRKTTGEIYAAEQLTFGSQSAFGKPVSISVTGEDSKILTKASQEIKNALEKLEALADVVDSDQEGLREVNITLKESALYLGLNLQEIVGQVRQGFFGSEIQRLQRGRDEVRVWVRYRKEERSSINDLENMRVRFTDGREFPLREIVDLNISRGVIAINHFNGKREIKIDADISNRDVSVSDITSNLENVIIPKILAGYPGVSASFEGQNREQAAARSSLTTALSLAMILMFFIIALTFRSISQTLVVFAIIPFSMIGVGMGHYMMGLPISMLSILGVLALIGILVNDTLVFVNTYNDLLREGKPQMEALYEAGTSRFRPIILTTLTTFAGLAPLLLEKSTQAQFLIPMAVSVAFGLLVVTVIILLLLPILLIVTNRIKVYALYAWEGVKPSYEMVEPAVEGRKYNFLIFLVAGIISIGLFGGLINGLMKVAGMLV